MHDAPNKVVSFQILGAWVKETLAIIESERKEEVGKRSLELGTIFSDAITLKLLGYIWDLWEDTFEGVSHQVREIFEMLVKILVFFDQDSGMVVKSETCEVGQRLHDLTKRLVFTPWPCKYKFPMLTILLGAGVSASAILEINGDFVVELLQQFG